MAVLRFTKWESIAAIGIFCALSLFLDAIAISSEYVEDPYIFSHLVPAATTHEIEQKIQIAASVAVLVLSIIVPRKLSERQTRKFVSDERPV